MTTNLETYALVELVTIEARDPEQPAHRAIGKIIRTYESHSRAMEDLDLMTDMLPGITYDVLSVPYIDR